MSINYIKSFDNIHSAETREEIRILCKGKSGIYCIKNKKSKRVYVGSCVSKSDKINRLYLRFNEHVKYIGDTPKTRLHRSIKKNGIHNFSYHIIEFMERGSRDMDTFIEEVRSRETHYLGKFPYKYNILEKGGNSTRRGYLHTEETKKYLSDNYSDERREQARNINLGKELPPATIEKLKAAAQNRSPETRQKIKEAARLFNMRFNKPITCFTRCELTGEERVVKEFPTLKATEDFFEHSPSRRIINDRLKSGKPYIIKLTLSKRTLDRHKKDNIVKPRPS